MIKSLMGQLCEKLSAFAEEIDKVRQNEVLLEQIIKKEIKVREILISFFSVCSKKL